MQICTQLWNRICSVPIIDNSCLNLSFFTTFDFPYVQLFYAFFIIIILGGRYLNWLPPSPPALFFRWHLSTLLPPRLESKWAFVALGRVAILGLDDAKKKKIDSPLGAIIGWWGRGGREESFWLTGGIKFWVSLSLSLLNKAHDVYGPSEMEKSVPFYGKSQGHCSKKKPSIFLFWDPNLLLIVFSFFLLGNKRCFTKKDSSVAATSF